MNENKTKKVEISVGKFWSYEPLSEKSIECLKNIESFYNQDKLRNLLAPVVNKKFDISCRTLEYCCVNLAKQKNIAYKVKIDNEIIVVNLTEEYNRWLNQWNRPNFDFFRRYTRIYTMFDGQTLETTVGQAHLFYWADKYGVLDYIRSNQQWICARMSETHKNNRKDKQKHKSEGITRKRKKLVNSADIPCSLYDMDVCISFNEPIVTTRNKKAKLE